MLLFYDYLPAIYCDLMVQYLGSLLKKPFLELWIIA